ncbi:hypothetical protein SCHPADRAFT_916313 [Schizopora paradoxa]|uniref:mRNA splicing factor n=1 Tax=Schizopora paradoxa TaxID=27342 RepID=A0A0H2RM61_9AGAM|nr:hypothetical protein SCHPADRAFT_916313 [Schizopora paradoxa]
MSLAEESESRKARLAALRRKKLGQNADEDQPMEEVTLSRRNFDPATRTLRKRTFEDDQEMEDTVEKNVEGLAEQIIVEDEQRKAEDLDLLNIAPKRINWDLKREMERKAAKLERQTQEAIYKLIRQRLVAQKGETDDLVGAIKAQEVADAEDDSDDDS